MAKPGIGVELFRKLGEIDAHDLRILQGSVDVRLEGADLSLPTEAETECRVEYGRRVERKGCAVEAVVVAHLGCAIGTEIVA